MASSLLLLRLASSVRSLTAKRPLTSSNIAVTQALQYATDSRHPAYAESLSVSAEATGINEGHHQIGVTEYVDSLQDVGPERWELIQKVKGIDNPFQMSTKTVAAGTKHKPTLIPTISNTRTVGCICEDDSPMIRWMTLTSTESQQCRCGHWFKLVPLEE